jgi:hypothetical protein
MIGHHYVNELIAAEQRQALQSDARLRHGSEAIKLRRTWRANRRAALLLRLARRLPKARPATSTPPATAATPAATPTT